MKKFILSLFILCNFYLGIAKNKEINNLEKSSTLLECTSLECISSKNNPEELFTATKDCIAKGEYNNAVSLYAIAGVYGLFDSYRVDEEVAEKVLRRMEKNSLGNLSPEELESFFYVVKESLIEKSSQLDSICEKIKQIGPPTYYPSYLLTKNAQDSTIAIVKDLKRAEGWKRALKNKLDCN